MSQSNHTVSRVERQFTTGIAGLDDILHGGWPGPYFYVVEGDPGSGKTTLGLQFLLEGRRLGERTLYVTLSETDRELRAVAESHGWSLDGIDINELRPVDEDVGGSDEQYTIFHPSEVELGITAKAVCDDADRVRPRRVVLDSVSEMRLLARDPLRFRRQILALKQFFGSRNCAVLLLDDRTAMASDLQLRTLSHGVLALEQLPQPFGISRRQLRVVKMRGSRFRDGFHDFAIETGGIVAYPRLVAAEHPVDADRGPVSSGIAALDTLLGGGFDRGTSTLVMGPAGVGKSTICMQYVAAAAARGERSAVFLFEESVANYHKRADGLGLDLAKPDCIEVRQIDPAELSPGAFVHAVRYAVERDDARIVVIDSLNGYLKAMRDEDSLVVQMHELLTYLGQRGVLTLFVVTQQGVIGSGMTTPVDVTYLADNVVLLRYFEADGAVRQAISVVKKRSGAHERTIRELCFGPGVIIGEPLTAFHGVLSGIPVFSGAASALARDAPK